MLVLALVFRCRSPAVRTCDCSCEESRRRRVTCSRTGGGVEANTDFTRAVAALGTSVRMPVMMYAKSCRSSELWGRLVGFLGYVSYVGYVGSKYGKWGSERIFFDSSPFIYYPKHYACRFLASSNNVQGRCYTRARNRSEHTRWQPAICLSPPHSTPPNIHAVVIRSRSVAQIVISSTSLN